MEKGVFRVENLLSPYEYPLFSLLEKEWKTIKKNLPPPFQDLCPGRIVFLDIETTYPTCGGEIFLVGMAYKRRKLVLRQFFLADPRAHETFYTHILSELSRAEGLITYNGKRFDIPKLRKHLNAWEIYFPFSTLPHWDLYQTLQKEWRKNHLSLSLRSLERKVLKLDREDDPEGGEIPLLYQEYLRTKNLTLLLPVFRHNAWDLFSTMALFLYFLKKKG